MGSGNRGDILGRLAGMLVFLVGVGMLVFVFMYAFKLFGMSPDQALGLHFTGDPKKDPPLALIGVQFGWIFLKVACLIVMSLAASFLSQKGINFYFSALQGSPAPSRPTPASVNPVVHSDAHGETS